MWGAVTDELQFGFKKATGCPQAVFSLQSVVEYFNVTYIHLLTTNVRGSSVFAAALDLTLLSTHYYFGL